MSGPAIEVHDLVVRYRKTVAVDRISFEARAGQIVALLGPNGAGKTSTVETLEGYRRPTVGAVRVLGLDPVRDGRALSRRIGVMLQKGGIYPAMSPREAVRLFAHYYDESEEPEGLLYRVGLVSVAATPWRQLSGGEQQRLSLALALVGRPWVAFLDEPTAGVDPQGRLAIREVINDLRSAGACVLLTTHEMQEAERLADRIIILDRGRIVADGTPSDLMVKEGGKEIRFGANAGLDTVALAAALAATVEEAQPGEYVVHAEGTPATIAALATWLAERNLAMADLRVGRQRLEDVFLRLTASPEAGNGGPPPAGDTATPLVSTGAGPGTGRAAGAGAPTPGATTPSAAEVGNATTGTASSADDGTTTGTASSADDVATTGTTGDRHGTTTGTASSADGATTGTASWVDNGPLTGETGDGTTSRQVGEAGAPPPGATPVAGRRRRRVGAGGRGPGATDPTPAPAHGEDDA